MEICFQKGKKIKTQVKKAMRPIAVETKDAIYAPIHDINGNIITLINAHTREGSA